MRKFADTLVGKIVLGVSTTLILSVIWWVTSSLTGIYEGAENGTEALKQNDVVHPKVDTICKTLKEKDARNDEYLREVKEEYERQTYRDSIRQAEALQYMERLINELEAK